MKKAPEKTPIKPNPLAASLLARVLIKVGKRDNDPSAILAGRALQKKHGKK